MADAPELIVELNRRQIARLAPAQGGGYELSYLPGIVAGYPGAFLLSVSLPVRAEPYPPGPTGVFLDGLLPEGRVRDRLCRRFRVDEEDAVGLLSIIGRDCAGAVSILPASEQASDQTDDAIEWLSDDELERLIAELPQRPLGIAPDQGIRISLAGAQDKLAVVIRDSRFGLPRGSVPSTHILKPASTDQTRRGHLLYPGLVENEAFCLCLAAKCGLNAATAEVRSIGLPVLIVTRYDRQFTTTGLNRVHQEDVCQALGVPARRKYEDDGGPGIVQTIDLLRRVSAAGAADVLAFLRYVAFAYLTGNLDAHAKNTSILFLPEGIRLAPLYDTLSTIVYPHLSNRLAMRIGGQDQADQLTARHWYAMLDALDLGTAANYRGLADFTRRVIENLPFARADGRQYGFDHPVLDGIQANAQRCAAALLELPDYARRTRTRTRAG
jgi:serine/threonine-protein kinase HipA